jgi:hypothetical protein
MEVTCTLCSTTFSKSEVEVKRTKNNFCSRKCSNTYYRSNHCPNPPKPRTCKICKGEYPLNKTHRSVFCPSCKPREDWSRGDITLQEAIYHAHHKSSAFALVRTRARAVLHKLGWNSCWICGYSKHVDAAHIRDIADFPPETRLSVINAPSNLAPLCRTHHWEFDHDMLDEPLVSPSLQNPHPQPGVCTV